MDSLQRRLIRLHPLLKVALYAHLLAVAVWGPLASVILVDVACLAFLLFQPSSNEMLTNPYYSLIFCLLAVLVVLPGGTSAEVIQAAKLSARLLNVMLASSAIGVVTRPMDFVAVSRLLRLSDKAVIIIFVMTSFLPLAQRSIASVIFAQRSRGLEINFISLFRPTVYRVLVVPYLVCILRSALDKWVSINLRPASEYKLVVPTIRTSECALFLASFGLWLI